MRTGKRSILIDSKVNDIFKPPHGGYLEIKKNAQLEDTLGLMKKVIATTLSDTYKISKLLKADTQKKTCQNIWEFCFQHLQYEKDEAGIEQVRRPSRTWQDRIKGVDCDCMTVFIGSILTNLKIPFLIRLTAYKASADFEHVYPVAQTDSGDIIMDCVVHQFNYQVPYITKKDIRMNLQYLNGFEENEDFDSSEHADLNFFFEQELEGLEGKADRRFNHQKRLEARKNKEHPILNKIGKGLNKLNRLNPVTAVIRGGILASMKTNLFMVAGKLRYTYWSADKAKANNMDMNKYDKLIRIRKRLERHFDDTGGRMEHFKKSILEGRGNRNRKVALNGFGSIEGAYSAYDDLQSVLGDEIYHDEFEGVKFSTGINGLGSVSASVAMASATGIIGTIAGLIKQLGSLFKKGSPQEQEEIINDKTAEKELKDSSLTPEDMAKVDISELPPEVAEKVADVVKQSADLPALIDKEESLPSVDKTEIAPIIETDNGSTGTPESSANNSTAPPPTKDEKTGIGQWIKDHPVLTAGIAIVVIGGAVWIYQNSKKGKGKGTQKNLNGVKTAYPKKKKPRTKSGAKPRVKYPIVELL